MSETLENIDVRQVIEDLFDARSRLALVREQIESCSERIDELIAMKASDADIRRARDKRRHLREQAIRLTDEALECEKLLLIGTGQAAGIVM